MIFRNWIVIIILTLIGLFLAGYWLTLPATPVGVTPQGGTEEAVKAVGAIAGALTTLGAAIFGVLGKLNEYKKTKLELEEKRIALDEKKKSADAS
jgi:hypothetical protein